MAFNVQQFVRLYCHANTHDEIVYLSGPMSKPAAEGWLEQARVTASECEARLVASGYLVINPYCTTMSDAAWSIDHDTWLKHDIRLMIKAGVTHIVLLPGWRDSNGAHMELQAARELNLQVSEYVPETNSIRPLEDQ